MQAGDEKLDTVLKKIIAVAYSKYMYLITITPRKIAGRPNARDIKIRMEQMIVVTNASMKKS